ncbi:hypothetical protein GTO91_02855 [Heliobacterium undosum]|uniref:Uncharacterized protein n=1 Tax=Heliomicrobium undosum TaxID=121734 RepID=A0A845L4H7_9FIRM|nr:hypothetical protein [Heliomicrobium undosum]MZP28658.1 hypothetical protein [Heliomicrobium undosum]
MGKVIEYRKVLAQAEGEGRLFITFMNGITKQMKPGEQRKVHGLTRRDIYYYERLFKKLEVLKRWEAIDNKRNERKIA